MPKPRTPEAAQPTPAALITQSLLRTDGTDPAARPLEARPAPSGTPDLGPASPHVLLSVSIGTEILRRELLHERAARS